MTLREAGVPEKDLIVVGEYHREKIQHRSCAACGPRMEPYLFAC